MSTAGKTANERQILDWLAGQRGAMLALLETLVNTDSGSYDKAGVDAVGAHIQAFLASQGIATEVVPDTKFGDAISATVGDLRIVNLYVVNGQDIGTEKYEFKLQWLGAVRDWLEHEARAHPRLVVLGDFNIAPDERDVHDPAVWNDQHILTSAPERAALRDLLGTGLHDGYRLLHQDAGVFSWWDYRQAAFRRDLGLRIDLTLVSDALRGSAVESGIDREPRTWERPSDHAPAWVRLGG